MKEGASSHRPTPGSKPNKWLARVVGIIILLAILVTAVAWRQSLDRVDAQAQHNFEVETGKVTEALDDRVQAYLNALYGFRGFYHASEEVGGLEFQRYLSSLDPAGNYPGISALYSVTELSPGQLAAFVSRMKSEDPTFTLAPTANSQEHFIVTHLGAGARAPAPGIDVAGNNERRVVLEQARDTGEPTASDTLNLFNEDGTLGKEQGFLITIPVYKDEVPGTAEQRRAALEGFVSAVFDYKKFFNDTFSGQPNLDEMHVRITDPAGAVVYEKGAAIPQQRVAAIPINVQNKQWTLTLQGVSSYGLSRSQIMAPYGPIVLGLLLVGLLLVVLWLHGRAQARAIKLAGKMTRDLVAERNHERIVERKLEESNSRYEMIAKATSEVVHDLDLETGRLWWNGALATQYGYTDQAAAGTLEWWIGHIHPDDAMKVNNEMDQLLNGTGDTWAGDYRFQKADGSYADVYDRIFVVRDKEGQPTRLAGSMLDVTKEKELERAKNEFISVASHQLRTPLGSIRWNLELLLDESKKLLPDVRERAQDAYSSTIRMLGLVNDLLSVARIEQGRVHDMPVKADLCDIIAMAVKEMQPIAHERKVAIKVGTGRSLPVMIDPKRFREAIQNLLSNAVKYTPPGGQVTVSAEEKGDDIEISVSDTGIGIPPKDAANLFAKFFRASNVLVTDTEGSGLGLFVVKSYVEAWGGKIWFTSKVGKGTTFYMSIPRQAKALKLPDADVK